jgi:hypothetical protein
MTGKTPILPRAAGHAQADAWPNIPRAWKITSRVYSSFVRSFGDSTWFAGRVWLSRAKPRDVHAQGCVVKHIVGDKAVEAQSGTTPVWTRPSSCRGIRRIRRVSSRNAMALRRTRRNELAARNANPGRASSSRPAVWEDLEHAIGPGRIVII